MVLLPWMFSYDHGLRLWRAVQGGTMGADKRVMRWIAIVGVEYVCYDPLC
jgi:hypothetical protein